MSWLAWMLVPSLGEMPSDSLEERLAAVERGSGGELGVAVIRPGARTIRRAGERFSLQSVMKLMVAMAALEQVDGGRWTLGERWQFRRSDLSVSHQPIKDRLGSRATISVTLAELIELMVTESCSGAADFVIRKLGGPSQVTQFLRRKGITGMSVDRQERDLQTNVVGLRWLPEYVDARRLDRDVARQSIAAKAAAYRRYQRDPRDTTTPEAMGDLLVKLLRGQLFSKRSTAYLLGVMERTATGKDRLRSGVPAGWVVGHKTGTSSSFQGLAWATNDVGYARNARGEWIVIVAMLRGSRLPYEARERVLADTARAVFAQ